MRWIEYPHSFGVGPEQSLSRRDSTRQNLRKVRAFDNPMSITIGTAPDSWGVWFPSDPKQTPWHRFLDEVVEAGFEWIELGPYGYLPTDIEVLRHELNRRRLKVSGTFA